MFVYIYWNFFNVCLLFCCLKIVGENSNFKLQILREGIIFKKYFCYSIWMHTVLHWLCLKLKDTLNPSFFLRTRVIGAILWDLFAWLLLLKRSSNRIGVVFDRGANLWSEHSCSWFLLYGPLPFWPTQSYGHLLTRGYLSTIAPYFFHGKILMYECQFEEKLK